uniref:Mitochondrial splicing suppressor 51-like C-terminal domain-containing protein n=1 Tax=Chromera velia CCMP2878 TaxID=1169474 RepID=A0A0G4GJH8_9ALVE|mmetsp:Transcript_15969/g.32384  ORF Transcript_15969/g.32384 Transcript_15969/m.32384 type:complete len:608 (+) Transcript_15969:128-1951(+)|eukprot:Cvel_4789.t1-p1 / transcript=Cvel_4789.t1 / gene=Cvel_4789 / organism=Chromera_velia_CCMP2878 / gene_product=Peptidyl-prolyl cis-trans isomerase D, putative / transcript_product=Peptidyl-prolyl cis-trans isomerase D, putative / location=Cvel_scaffold214:21513-25742(-) / protein_length=607 / sequence_SO=supercontig / SO=protein_coding / is_pseudo=false
MSDVEGTSVTPTREIFAEDATPMREEDLDSEMSDVDVQLESSSSSSSSTFDSKKGPSAEHLKEQGNQMFAQGDVHSAMELWKNALKQVLKGSLLPSSSTRDLTVQIRLNLCSGHLKLSEWTDALTQSEVVLRMYPSNEKALYRNATAHLKLQEFNLAEKTLDRLEEVNPENMAASALRREVAQEKAQVAKQRKSLFARMMQVSSSPPSADSPDKEKEEKGQESLSASVGASTGLHSSTQSASAGALGSSADCRGEIEWQPEDRDDSLWGKSYSVDSEADCGSIRRLLTLSLPLTTLHAVERAAAAGGRLGEEMRRLPSKERLCVHFVGARGDFEMSSSFAAFFLRMPRLRFLSVVCVGFLDKGDSWGRSLATEQLTPPIPKKVESVGGRSMEDREDPRIHLRLWKGTYHSFLNQNDDEKLENDRDCLLPDIVVFANAGLSLSVNSWAPSLAAVAKRNFPAVITGYSARDEPTNDALDMETVARAVGLHVHVPTEFNRYAIWLRHPEKRQMATKVWRGYYQPPREIFSDTGKNAVLMVGMGAARPAESLQDLREPQEATRGTTIPSYLFECEQEALKKTLVSLDVEILGVPKTWEGGEGESKEATQKA